ncbi:MAG: hypothetical protein HYX66_08815 [Ignavibacteria bacterium]|nr:hypothetical protein [Ignavibacteria bacterium]
MDLPKPFIKGWEIESILKRSGYLRSEAAILCSMNPKTFRERISKTHSTVFPQKLTDQLRIRIGTDVFDAALHEIRSGTRSTLWVNGEELLSMLRYYGWSNSYYAKRLGKSASWVSSTLLFGNYQSAVPIRWVSATRKLLSLERFDSILAGIRRIASGVEQ